MALRLCQQNLALRREGQHPGRDETLGDICRRHPTPCLSATPIVAPIVAPVVAPRPRSRRRGLSLVLPRTLRCSMGPVIPRATSRNDRISANRAHVDKSIRALRGSQPHVCAVPMESMHTGQGPHLLTGREGFQTDRALENRRGRRIARQMHNIRHHCVPLHVERDRRGGALRPRVRW